MINWNTYAKIWMKMKSQFFKDLILEYTCILELN